VLTAVAQILPVCLPVEGQQRYDLALRRDSIPANFRSTSLRELTAVTGEDDELIMLVLQPCFDEPLLKATFSISLISRTGTVSLSNSNAVSIKALGPISAFPRSRICAEDLFEETKTEGETREKEMSEKRASVTTVAEKLVDGGWVLLDHDDAHDDSWEITEFAKTPRMSTYLVAFANGNLESVLSLSFRAVAGRRPLTLVLASDISSRHSSPPLVARSPSASTLPGIKSLRHASHSTRPPASCPFTRKQVAVSLLSAPNADVSSRYRSLISHTPCRN
jgi:hypothetical protein